MDEIDLRCRELQECAAENSRISRELGSLRENKYEEIQKLKEHVQQYSEQKHFGCHETSLGNQHYPRAAGLANPNTRDLTDQI